jgi:hypothetical protein
MTILFLCVPGIGLSVAFFKNPEGNAFLSEKANSSDLAWKLCFFNALFDYFDIIYYIHAIHHIQTVHSSIVIRRSSSPSPPWVAEPRIELGPALQQADALSTELRHTT